MKLALVGWLEPPKYAISYVPAAGAVAKACTILWMAAPDSTTWTRRDCSLRPQPKLLRSARPWPPSCPSAAISARPRSSWQIIQQSKRGNKNSCMSCQQHPPKPKMTLNDGHKNSRDLETYVLYVGTYALLATFTSFGNRQVESVQDRCLKFGVQLTQNPSSFIQRNYLNLIANFCCDDYNFVHF